MSEPFRRWDGEERGERLEYLLAVARQALKEALPPDADPFELYWVLVSLPVRLLAEVGGRLEDWRVEPLVRHLENEAKRWTPSGDTERLLAGLGVALRAIVGTWEKRS